MVTRLLLSLFPLLIVSGAVLGEEKEKTNQKTAAQVVAELIGVESLENAIKDAMIRLPEADRWSGVDEKQIFGLTVVPFTDRDLEDGDVGMFRKTAELLAMKEMLFAKVLLDKYAATGLNDSGTLREAVANANESFFVQSKITYDVNETRIKGNRIVGIVVADRDKVVAIMTEQARIDDVRSAYRNVAHRQAKRLIAADKFEESLTRFMELRLAKLLERDQLFDVLRCFVGLDKPTEAEKIIASLTADHAEDVELYRRLASIVETGNNMTFRKIKRNLNEIINRLDPPELPADQVLDQILNEISEHPNHNDQLD